MADLPKIVIAVKGSRCPKGYTKAYGHYMRNDLTKFAVHLWAYKTNLTIEKGGLGAEAHFRKAFKIAWPKFFWHKWMEMEISAWCQDREFTAIGHTRASKTYGCAYIILLDWLADPMVTLTTIASMSLERLRSTLGRDILEALNKMSMIEKFVDQLDIINSTNEFRISLMPQPGMNLAQIKELKSYGIIGIAIKSMNTAQIQGRHTPRRRMIGDEVAAFPEAYFTAEANAASAPDFRGVHLANPNEKTTKFGMSCEPAGGWSTVDENTLYYRNKVGRLILHFNGLKSYNLILYDQYINKEITKEEYEAKEAVFLIRQDYVAKIEKDTLQWYMYVLGWFPRDGLVNRVWPDNVLEMGKKDITYDFKPTPLGLCDPAYEHDSCVLQLGHYGLERDGMTCIQMKSSHTISFDLTSEVVKEFQIAREIIRICKEAGVLPENFAMDCTGNGRAIAAILDNEWGKIHRIEWGGAASERPMSGSDENKACDNYRYFVDELAFRLRYWMMAGRLGGLQNLHKKTIEQLSPRQYNIQPGNMTRVESKDDYKKRLGESPDYADALMCLGELMARKGIFPDAIDEDADTNPDNSALEKAIAAAEIYEDEYCGEQDNENDQEYWDEY